jgi:casein kinase II subunit alpha
MLVAFKGERELTNTTEDSLCFRLLGTYTRKPWESFITEQNKHLCTPESLDLLDKLLTFDHQARPTCQEAMQHECFAEVRRQEAENKGKGGSVSSDTEM